MKTLKDVVSMAMKKNGVTIEKIVRKTGFTRSFVQGILGIGHESSHILYPSSYARNKILTAVGRHSYACNYFWKTGQYKGKMVWEFVMPKHVRTPKKQEIVWKQEPKPVETKVRKTRRTRRAKTVLARYTAPQVQVVEVPTKVNPFIYAWAALGMVESVALVVMTLYFLLNQ